MGAFSCLPAAICWEKSSNNHDAMIRASKEKN